MQDSNAFLQVSGLSKYYGSFAALKKIDLLVFKGELVCFLGPSGCGKTTLLRAIAGLEVQSEGKIIQAGVDVSHLPPAQRDFGIVFQSYALFPNLSIHDNIAYGLKSEGIRGSKATERVNELLELVELPDESNKYPQQLSGGQQQRIALARALAVSPGLLLLDEPLSALDAQVRTKLRAQIKKLQKQLGITTVMVTHDQEEALEMADRIVVLRDGEVEQIGTPLEIYNSPATEFVAGFIGEVNTLERDNKGGYRGIRPENIQINQKQPKNATVVSSKFFGSYYRVAATLDFIESTVEFNVASNEFDQDSLVDGKRISLKLPEENEIRVGAVADV